MNATMKICSSGAPRAAMFLARLGLYFPAKAVGETLSFRQAFRKGRGLGWRMLCSGFLAILPLLAFQFLWDFAGRHVIAHSGIGAGHFAALFLISALWEAPAVMLNILLTIPLIKGVSAQYYQWLAENRLKGSAEQV